ncbi:MAG: helicase-related protein [Patescibacteria group bacterium]
MKNQKLPVDSYRAQIINSVINNSVVIITAETGAGKSTRVPQFLLDEGYSLVVTQPRRLAARSVAKRVAQERNCELGSEIGFRTAYEKQDGPNTRCLFVTDGLALVRELMGTHRHQILVLDEVHEWNLNMEVLVAWSKRQIESGVEFKLVIMSATLEAEKLSLYFNNAPVISIPGRCYPVEEQVSSGNMGQDISSLLKEGRNVLAFQPGKKEIGELWSQLESYGLNAEILPLHGELEADEQDRVFRSYSRPKCVIATNVAQTSITIEDIDAVVDGGTERRIELNEGVEGLFLKAISLADRAQRKGRAGRCREGVYIDCCPTDDENRLAFPEAEILRVRLDQTVLRLAEAKIDAEELNFFHQPPQDQIHEAKQALRALGCMDESGLVTAIGRQVSRLPISVQYGRMVIAAEKYGVVDDIIDIAAILEQGGVTARKVTIGDDVMDAVDLWRPAFCPKEEDSDPMAQLAVFRGARNMSNEERRLKGVFVKAYHQARDRRQLLANALKGKISSFQSSGKREDILKALCAGMVEHLYQGSWSDYRNGDGYSRRLSNESIVNGKNWIVGQPFDLATRRGIFRLVTMATNVDTSWLVEVAPQLAKVEEGVSPKFDSEKDVCVSTRQTFFNDMLVKEEVLETPDHPEAAKIFGNWLVNKLSYGYSIDNYEFAAADNEIIKRAKELNRRAGEKIFVYPFERSEWQEFVSLKLVSAKCLAEIKVEDFLLTNIDAELEAKVLADNPDSILVNGEEISVNYNNNQAAIRINAEQAKNQIGTLSLAGGRQLRLYVDSYTSFDSFDEVNVYFENRRLEEAWRIKESELRNAPWLESGESFVALLKELQPLEYAQKDNGEKVYAFPYISLSGNSFRLAIHKDSKDAKLANRSAIISMMRALLSGEFFLESDRPWYSWGWTAMTERFQTESTRIISQVVERANAENFSELLSESRQGLRTLKANLLSENSEVGELIEEAENNFSNHFSNQSLELISEESSRFRYLVSEARSLSNEANFLEAKVKINEANNFIAGLVDLLKTRQADRDALVRANNIPAYLLNAFANDVDRALQFMDNVSKLPTRKIDAHEISCGRARVSRNLSDVWSSIGETSDFFCGADPNDVKYYVSEYHFGNDTSYEEPKQLRQENWQDKVGTSNDAMAEALRRAGLIK